MARAWLTPFALVWLLGPSACLRKDYPVGRDTVYAVELHGASSIDADELEARLSTAPSPRFLKLWDGVVYDYEVFDEALLARDLLRIERYYRARGYYQAKVTAARVVRVDAHRVRVDLEIHEGQPTLVDHVSPRGLERVPIDVAADAIRAIRLKPGEPFDEALFDESKQQITDILADSGYAFAQVTAKADVDVPRRRADVTFDVTPGDVATFGDIHFVGLHEIPEGPVRSNFLIERGERFSKSALKDAQDALNALGVFSDVEIRTDRSHPETRQVPVTVVVQEASLRGIRLGIGATADVLRVATHLRAGWEDRNFLGGMRSFSIDTTPGVTLFPARIDHLVAPTRLLPENRLHTELRQPSFVEGRTTGIVSGDFNVVPLLYPVRSGEDPNDQTIIGYREYRASVGAERAFFGHHLNVNQSFDFEARDPFAYQLPPATGLPAGINLVTVIYPELTTNIDFRDDPIEPHLGAFVTNSLQVAVPLFPSSVSDVRVRPEVRGYVPLSKHVTLALRTTFGFLFPQNYGSTAKEGSQRDDPAAIEDQHKLLLRAFYTGGPDSNRGYPYQGIGRTGPIGFLLPTGVQCPVSVPSGTELDPACTRPLGGLTLWEASMEVRFPIIGPVRGALFADASNVTPEVGTLEFNPLHLSIGPGFRYLTPVGPVRLDVGWRVTPVDRSKHEAIPPTVFGLPIAVDIAIGEAF